MMCILSQLVKLLIELILIEVIFYIHYQDKINLLEELYQDAIEGIHQSIKKPYRNKGKVFLNGVIPSNKLIFEYIEKHKKLFKALDLIEDNPDI